MKVNFNADFKDFNGEPLLVDGNPQVIITDKSATTR